MTRLRTQDIQYGIAGQTLILDCEDGRPASVTSVTVYQAAADDTSTAELATTGSAAVESSPNTTLSAAAGSGVNPTSLSLTSASGVTVGRAYRLTGAGLYEDVEVVGISGTTITSKYPLINDYASGSTFVSCRCTIAIDSTWVADLSNVSPTWTPNPAYRVRWVVVDSAGATQVYDRYFDLVRYPARHGVTPLQVEARFPGWLDALPVDARADQGRDLIARSFEAVKFDLYGDNKADQFVRNAEVLAELVITRAPLLAVEDAARYGATVDAQRYDIASKDYRQRYEQMVRAPVLAMDSTGAGGAEPTTRTPLLRR